MGGLTRLKLLLDTHIILWCGVKPERLSEMVTREIERPSNELWFSPISLWEILILAEKGKISLGDNPKTAIRKIFQRLPNGQILSVLLSQMGLLSF